MGGGGECSVTCIFQTIKHNNYFMYKSKRNSRELSKFIWGKKKEKLNVNLEWSILGKARPFSPASKKKHVMSYRETSHFVYKESVEQMQ